MTVSAATMTELPIARRTSVCLNSVAKAANDQLLREDRGALAKDGLPPGALNAARRGSRRANHKDRNDDQRDVAQNKARTSIRRDATFPATDLQV